MKKSSFNIDTGINIEKDYYMLLAEIKRCEYMYKSTKSYRYLEKLIVLDDMKKDMESYNSSIFVNQHK